MTREEIIKIFEENHIAKGSATINATKLAEIFTKHEADLLKEFVGYWHRHWGNNWGIYNYAVNDSVDIALEQFIKENEK